MLVLRSSAGSPYGRKIKIAMALLGLSDRISVVSADTLDPADSLRTQNPLGKIPILLLEDGTALFDSRVIAEYLDFIAGGNRLIPAAGPARFDVLRLQALADGIMDAALLRVYEGRYRPAEKHEQKWLDHQTGKVERALASLESAPLPDITSTPDIGKITLACAFGYLDLRAPGWRAAHPRLGAWVDDFERAVPAFAATHPPK
ncbi:glutathione S-transferase [Terrihabitans soli]|uniref:Glutathione S-transferase n=1 Tax=Terrihabitans soli TaxID=708113 RepID=A0A6S6QIR3_9HYPH|nr:glutathione S-transferase family protein [Terrihabitans soli]BCJ90134.1 glutathione S-transferase [Terrihabitans soli]